MSDLQREAISASERLIERLVGAFEAFGMSEWRPIDTAPQWDKCIIVYCPRDNSVWIARRQGGGGWRGMDEIGLTRDSLEHHETLTHWMPLPNPPTPRGWGSPATPAQDIIDVVEG